MKKIVALLAVLTLTASAAWAQTGTYMPLPSSAKTAPASTSPEVTAAEAKAEEVAADEEQTYVEEAITKVKVPNWAKPGMYLSGQLGAYGPADDQFENDYQPDDGVAANLIFGYRINTFACIQGELGYYDSDGVADYQFNGMPLMAALRLGVPLWNFDIYVTGGLGAVFYKTEDYSMNKDEVAVASQLGLGTNFYFTRHFFAGFEGRYMMTDIEDAPNDGVMLLGQIGWKF